MGQESKTVGILKGQLSKFSGIISKRFKKPKQKLIQDILYGIQASKEINGNLFFCSLLRTERETEASR